MREREASIAARLRDAEEKAREATEERSQTKQRFAKASEEVGALLASSRRQATEQAEQIITAARAETSRLMIEAQQANQEHERLALSHLEAQIRESAVTLAGSLICEAAGPIVHEQLVARFLEQETQGAARMNMA